MRKNWELNPGHQAGMNLAMPQGVVHYVWPNDGNPGNMQPEVTPCYFRIRSMQAVKAGTSA